MTALPFATETIPAMLAARRGPDAAILGDSGMAMNYLQLSGMVGGIARELHGSGIRRGDRVAIAVSNGPGAALAFLGAATAGIAAPLNPAYTESEFRFALSDLPASILITDGSVKAASKAAGSIGVPELKLGTDLPVGNDKPTDVVTPRPDDVALVLHTSGTTGRPKRVPLTHANLVCSARGIAASLDLTPADRCLNVMPLFHIHGLVASLLATLGSGGSVVCTPGFDAFRVFAWLEEFRPSWLTAVPTMHQAILSRARGREPTVRDHGLRFVRSSSSALPPAVMKDVEVLFGAPLVEAYGMTEASHQIAVNALPPGERRPGSVGRPRGVEVSVMAAEGAPVPTGSKGEVVIRGPSVSRGYEGIDPQEFTYPGGWLRTGDEGYLDSDGYLWLTGRLKELVNRGGEKISPREVEEVLLAHPAVAQVVVFAVPHERLGEEVAAAVVLKAEAVSADAAELRAFAGKRLAAFKVPRKLVFLEAIPLGPTGKPQRIGMAKRLGIE